MRIYVEEIKKVKKRNSRVFSQKNENWTDCMGEASNQPTEQER